MQFFDTHAHLDDEQFDDCREDVVRRAVDAGVTRMIAVGCTWESSLASIQLAESYGNVWAAVGIQPNYCGEAKADDWDRIRELARRPRVVAIGETGLDRYWDFTDFSVQEDYFRRHLSLARELELPFIVHMRDCGDDIVRMLREDRERGPLLGVMHSFTGDEALAKECLDLGMYISFAGMVTFKKSQALRDVACVVPSDRLLIETDAPYLAPHPHRGKRPNEPAWVVHTAECLAETLGLPLAELAERTTENACRLFAGVARN